MTAGPPQMGGPVLLPKSHIENLARATADTTYLQLIIDQINAAIPRTADLLNFGILQVTHCHSRIHFLRPKQ